MYYQNITQEHDIMIARLKDWTRANFIFNKNTVFYATYDNVKELTPLPESLAFPEYHPEKKLFNTPLSHLMYTLIALGEYRANSVFQKQMMDSILANKENAKKEKSPSKKSSKKSTKKEEK